MVTVEEILTAAQILRSVEKGMKDAGYVQVIWSDGRVAWVHPDTGEEFDGRTRREETC